MKKIALTALALAVSAGSALAADLPSRKAPVLPPPPPPPTWTGFYAGLNAGYGFSSNNQGYTQAYPLSDRLANDINVINPANFPFPFTVTGPWFLRSALIPGVTALANTGSSSINQSGFVGGGQVGYNYQVNSAVFGIEADIQGSTQNGGGNYYGAAADKFYLDRPTGTYRYVQVNRSAIGGGNVQAGVDWLGTVRGRIGYLVSPTFLAYATGGLAYGGVHASSQHYLAGTVSAITETAGEGITPITSAAIPGTGSISQTRVGWTAGGGFEWLFASNWSLKTEALYYNLGGASFDASPMTAYTPSPVDFLVATNLGPPIPPFIGIPIYGSGAALLSNVPRTRVNFDGVIVRAGVNYHFNWGAAPVVAKY
jgi:opacity protein-like surface antigen